MQSYGTSNDKYPFPRHFHYLYDEIPNQLEILGNFAKIQSIAPVCWLKSKTDFLAIHFCRIIRTPFLKDLHKFVADKCQL